MDLPTIIEKYEEKLSGITKQRCKISVYTFEDASGDKGPCHTFNVLGSGKPGDVPSISSFKLKMLPGCCGVCISTGSYVYPNFRGKGIGTLLNSFRIDVARCMRYGLLMCTDVVDNIPQRKLLNKNGWKEIVTFNNPQTKNNIAMHVIDLNERLDNVL
jgi:GNAT superfamily N-acetyltransferase